MIASTGFAGATLLLFVASVQCASIPSVSNNATDLDGDDSLATEKIITLSRSNITSKLMGPVADLFDKSNIGPYLKRLQERGESNPDAILKITSHDTNEDTIKFEVTVSRKPMEKLLMEITDTVLNLTSVAKPFAVNHTLDEAGNIDTVTLKLAKDDLKDLYLLAQAIQGKNPEEVALLLQRNQKIVLFFQLLDEPTAHSIKSQIMTLAGRIRNSI